jgi:hypothetical protein
MTFAFAPLSYTLPYWPDHLFGKPDFLDRVGVSKFEIESAPDSLAMEGKLNILDTLETKLPALDAVTVAFFPDATGGFTEIPWRVDLVPDFAVTLTDLKVALRIESKLLHRVKQSGGKWAPDLDAQNQPKPVEIAVSGATASVSGDGDIDVTGNPTIALTPMAIGETGIVIEATGIVLHLSDKAPPLADAPPGFKGVAIDQIAVHLGDTFEGFGGPDDIKAGKLFIGSTGFSGTISAEWTSPPTAGRLAGLPFTPKSIGISFAQNKLTGMSLEGTLTLPFFDHPLDVKVGYDANGGLAIAVDSSDGLFTLTKPNFLKVVVESLEIDISGKRATVSICGEITPLYGGLPWPSFEVRSLSIDSEGHVKLDGGWIDLSAQKAMNFNAFTLQITKFGLGKLDGGGRWFGLSCKVNLIKGVEGKAEIDGLRLLLREGGGVGISLDGVGVEMKIAGAFELAGAVKFTDDGVDKRFDGGVTLSLKKPELLFDTQLTIGERNDSDTGEHFRYFAMYGGLELPTGIPLGASGVGLFGFAGLFALNMRPARKPASEPWYALPPGESWYHRDTPGVNKLTKWGPRKGATAFGAGLTLGTYADNGFTFNARGLLVIAFPGPLVMIEMRANLLKDRKELAGSAEPLFRALAVLDEEAGEYTFGLDAFYKYDAASGGVIDIRGSLEAYYNKKNPRAWHIWLGKDDPRESRIQAKIISLFQANCYFMIEASGLKTGAWIGYDKSWNPKPLSITLQAWLDANAAISVKPNHFHADLWLHAAIELSAFGVGAGLSADALLAADVMDPFHILGELSVTLKLPKPLKPITRDVKLEWGPKGHPPPIPIVLKAVGIEHLKSAAVWSLEMNKALVPSYDDGNGFLAASAPPSTIPPPSDVPIVPMDARPSIAFGRAVHDDAMIGVNAVVPVPDSERIGDPAKGQGPAEVRYALKGIVLEKRPPGQTGWIAVAGKGEGVSGLPALYGSWAAVPSGTAVDAVDQTKLMVWSKTGFDQTRLTGDKWNDWFAAAFPNYPCVEAPPLTTTCYDFEAYPLAAFRDAAGQLVHLFTHASNAEISFEGMSFTVEPLAQPVDGRAHVLRPAVMVAATSQFLLTLSGAAAQAEIVRIVFDNIAVRTVRIYGVDRTGIEFERELEIHAGEVELALDGNDIGITVVMNGRFGVVEICLGRSAAGTGGTGEADSEKRALAANLNSATSVWSDQDEVLEPFTDYRLVIATEAAVTGEGAGTRSQISHAYFRTGGPPLLGGFTIPVGQTAESIAAGPDNLANYVAQTVPPTIGRNGEAPALPRPVFRAYDVGVTFKANHVDLLYKMARRDLMLQILDSNGAPARDEIGRALSFLNPWGVTPELVLDKASLAWLAAVDPECVPIDQSTIVHNQTVGTSRTPLLLDPTTRYRARLAPLLLHDDFAAPAYSDGAAASVHGDWHVADLDSAALPSQWIAHNVPSVDGIFVVQDVASAGAAATAGDLPLGSALIWRPGGASPAWTWQRLSAFVRSAAGAAAAGLVFLHENDQSYFQVTLSPNDGMCRLVRRTPAGAVALAEEAVAFAALSDAELAVEVSDGAIRAFVDGQPALTHRLDLSKHPGGTIGLWCWNNADARFKDVRVEDLRVEAFGAADQKAFPVAAFAFDFVTSEHVNYFHLVQARRTPVWDIETEGGDKARSIAELAALSDAAAGQSGLAPSAVEARQYEDLAQLWLGPGLVRDPVAPEINRILRGGAPLGWLIRSPEPWDWERSEITLLQSSEAMPPSYVLGPVKITGAALGMSSADDEYVDLIALETVRLAGWKLQLHDTAAAAALLGSPLDDPSPAWLDLHDFTGPETISSGLRIRLWSGANANPVGDHTWRSMNIGAVAALLPAFGADLRLLDSSGRVACAVRIAPNSAFAPIQPAPRLLRKADATGLIVLPNAGDSIAPGAYGVAMVYRRDRSQMEPGSIVLSQADDTTNEEAFVPLY